VAVHISVVELIADVVRHGRVIFMQYKKVGRDRKRKRNCGRKVKDED
jgi:hypothetical protein